MRDDQDRQTKQNKMGGRALALVVAAFIVLFAILAWGPWNTQHVASNPGPSGTPGSTDAHVTPPPATGPSGTTTGTAR